MSRMNDNCLEGWACPNCGSQGPFYVEVTQSVLMTDNGTDVGGGDVEHYSNSPACCKECDYSGLVRDFRLYSEFWGVPVSTADPKKDRVPSNCSDWWKLLATMDSFVSEFRWAGRDEPFVVVIDCDGRDIQGKVVRVINLSPEKSKDAHSD